MTKRRPRREDMPTAYGFGVVSLATLALIGLRLAIYIAMSDSSAQIYAIITTLVATFFLWPFWLGCGIACIMSVRKTSVQYNRDLALLGFCSFLGILQTRILLSFEYMALLMWFVYYGVIFGLLIYFARWRKQTYGSKVQKTKMTNGEKGRAVIIVSIIVAMIILLMLGTMLIQ